MEDNQPNYSNSPQQSNNFGQQKQHYQNQGSYQFPDQGEKLPGDPIAITLGIVSLVVFFIGCWCYGIIAIFTLILSIIGLVIANKSIKLYRSDPNKYSQSSEKSVGIAKIINIIGVSLSSLVCFILLVVIIFFGSIFVAAMNGELNDFKDLESHRKESSYDNEEASETEEEWKYYDEEELDSLETETDSASQIEGTIMKESIQK